jgi:hypothetical protein
VLAAPKSTRCTARLTNVSNERKRRTVMNWIYLRKGSAREWGVLRKVDDRRALFNKVTDKSMGLGWMGTYDVSATRLGSLWHFISRRKFRRSIVPKGRPRADKAQSNWSQPEFATIPRHCDGFDWKGSLMCLGPRSVVAFGSATGSWRLAPWTSRRAATRDWRTWPRPAPLRGRCFCGGSPSPP